MPRQKIRTFLWFEQHAEDAARLYCSLFENSRVLKVTPYPEGSPGPVGSPMTVEFELDGVSYVALNGGPIFKLTEAVSLTVACDDQREIDRLWEPLAEGGQPSRCGWLTDRYGLTWQIVPTILPELLGGNDGAKSARVMRSLMTMSKIDIEQLQLAAIQV